MRIPKHATHEYRLSPHDKCEVQVKVNAAEMQWRHYSWHYNEALARVEMRRLIALRDGKVMG